MKKWSSFLALVLCLVMLLGMLPSVQGAEVFGDFEYIYKGDGMIEIFRYNGSDDEVVIPETINGRSVTSIGKQAFYHNQSTQTVVIADCVTSIGESAFADCYRLANITLPSNLETLEKYAFGNCDQVRTVVFPEGLKNIGQNVFSGCNNLESIDLPSTIESIGVSAFSACAFKELVIPDTVKSIGSNAFSSNNNLSTLIIGDGVEFIGDHAFGYCKNLVSPVIGSRLQEIGDDIFADCKNLSHIIFRGTKEQWSNVKNADSIDPRIPLHYEADSDNVIINATCSITAAYCNICESYFWHNIASNHHHNYDRTGLCVQCNAAPGLFYDMKEDWTLEIIRYGQAGGGDVVISDTIEGFPVTSIGEGAFFHARTVTSITVADSITYIGEVAFNTESSELKRVTICNKDCEIYPSAETLGSAEYTTIYGYIGSTAEQYAKYFGYTFVALDEIETSDKNTFEDVKESDYFAEPVRWAVENEITNGVDPMRFAPDALCTRGQVVTFLWRACGSPKPTSSDNPFVDVDTGDYYYKAVLWALEKGITTGVNKTRFGPHGVCTRGQVATFLWRAQGKPAIESSKNPFSDVSKTAYYFDAVIWAVENEITQGMGGGKFAPDTSCTRGQIVTFLYRALT